MGVRVDACSNLSICRLAAETPPRLLIKPPKSLLFLRKTKSLVNMILLGSLDPLGPYLRHPLPRHALPLPYCLNPLRGEDSTRG
jgi:hypothetical protein